MNNTELFAVRETLNDDFEEGYNAGFDDGFDMAMLTEGDERFVVDTCMDVYHYCTNTVIHMSKESIKDAQEFVKTFASKKYRALMESRKTGISALFNEVMEEHDVEKVEG